MSSDTEEDEIDEKYAESEVVSTTAVTSKVVLQIRKGDLTNEKVDAIVNAANSKLQHYGGLAWAIVKKGGNAIQEESDKLTERNGAPISVGTSVYTGAGKLPCKHVIHTVGPIYDDGTQSENVLLAQAVESALKQAESLKCQSISIPAISSGIFGYPLNECCRIIIRTIMSYIHTNLSSSLKEVRITNIDDPTVQAMKEALKYVLAPRAKDDAAASAAAAVGTKRSASQDEDSKKKRKKEEEPAQAPAPAAPAAPPKQQTNNLGHGRWYWRGAMGKLEEYSKEDSKKLENGLTNGAATVTLTIKQNIYKVDLLMMKQRNITDKKAQLAGTIRDVVRKVDVAAAAAATKKKGWWEWEEKPNQWTLFEKEVAAKLEEQIEETKKPFLFHIGGYTYSFDMAAMTQTNTSSKTVRKIRRRV